MFERGEGLQSILNSVLIYYEVMSTNVGVSAVDPEGDQKVLGDKLVREAREDGGIEKESFGILFTSTDFNFRSLVNEIDEEINSEWVGGTTVAEMSSEGSGRGTAVFMLIESDEISFDTLESSAVSEGPEKAAGDAVSDVERLFEPDKNSLLFTLVPGFTIQRNGREFKFLQGLEKELDKDVKISGGSTGDSHRLRENYQIANGEIYADNAVMALIQTEKEIITGQAHGFKDSVRTGVVTQAEGRILKEISGKPAAEFYADAIGEKVSELNSIYDAKALEKLKAGLYYIYLKLRREDPNMFDQVLKFSLESAIAQQITPGNYRIIAPLEVRDGGIVMMDKIKEEETVDILETDKESVIEAGRKAFDQTSPEETLFGIVADCANRHMILDRNDRDREIERVTEKIGENMIGFYGEGEIGDGGLGICTFMSQTITGFAVKK
ncbi:hypothetical protein AQV86_01820 [Nanohaloarchaea archaeon SG9]|nr:hypothetical protein AQV86_01820 [Nanohaloarchaea archaeon SG9]